MTQLLRILIASIFISACHINANAVYFRHLSLTEGLSQPSVMTITQDALGRMWFGTREGLNIYDGRKVDVYKGWVNDPQTGAPVWIGNQVMAIVSDRNNNLFCIIDNDLIKYDLKTEQFSRITDRHDVSALSQFNGTVSIIAGNSLYTKHLDSDSLILQMSIPGLKSVNSMLITDRAYYICAKRGLYEINRKNSEINNLFPMTQIHSAFCDSAGDIWVSAKYGGLYRMKPGKQPQLMSEPTVPDGMLGAQQTRDAVEDEYGNIWYGSFTGLFCYNPNTNRTRRIELPTNLGGLTHPSIFSMYRDSHGSIWAGSYYGGVNYFTPRHDDFINYNYDGHAPAGLYQSFIIDMAIDKRGDLWFGTDGAGVCCVDSLWNIKEQLSSSDKVNSIRQNNIKCITYDSGHDRLYIGTHLGGLACYDIATRRMHNFIDSQSYREVTGDIIHHLKIHRNHLYISSRKGLSRMNLDTQEFSKVPTPEYMIFKFDINNNGDIYSRNNYYITKFNPDNTQHTDTLPIIVRGATDHPLGLLYHGNGLYVSANGNGLFYCDEPTGHIRHFTTHNSSIPSNYCYNLCAGTNGKIFMTTDYGIVSYNPADSSFRAIKFSNIFPESHIISECGLLAKDDGTILVGSTKGITAISEKRFDREQPDDTIPVQFYFSHLSVLNKEILPNDRSGILTQSLPFAKEIKLRHHQDNFSLRLGLSDYINPPTNHQFEYRLDGVDQTWQTTDNGEIHYTNLDPGRYMLHARYISDDDNAESHEIRLGIVVHHPWYATWWAWLIYIIAITSAISYYFINRHARTTLELSLEKERIEKRQIEKLNHEKLVFFTNVSHEFQTPLTLIMSHIDLLMAKYSRHSTLIDALKRIRNHTEQMSHLITQLLEFRKLQQNYQTLHVARHNAAITLNEVASPFNSYAAQRGISFTINTPDNSLYGYYDSDLMRKVLVNIISNAFKYTPDNGSISVSTDKGAQGEIIFRISDTGRGIAPDDINYIFDRFYNGSINEGHGLNYKSTGIGLAFAKSIVDKHQGTIRVESRQGQGSTFTVTIPGTKEAFDGKSNIVFETSQDIPVKSDTRSILGTGQTDLTGPVAFETESTAKENKPIMLIVEDNAELRRNLYTFFSQYYTVENACDGREGLQMTNDLHPDIIISDIMMPEMSGTDLCRAIKADINLCHIPVILLTALSSPEHNLEGLKANADDYITKPFDARMLLARIDNLLRNRRLLQHQFDRKPISEIDLTAVNPIDRDLLGRTSQIIDRYMSNSELDIPMICRELGISRSLFYNKFKALTGMTPNSFILNYRLKHAASLLETNPRISVAEVSDQTGFSTTVYFSRCFKKQFGIPPQQYQKNATAGDNVPAAT